MPIRFRCGHCKKLLGIARRKAGTDTVCPHCGAIITVPQPAPDDLDDIDALLNAPPPPPPPAQPVKPAPPPRPAAAPPAAEPPPPVPAPPPPAPPDGERPLFERDLEDVLGVTNKAADRAVPAGPKPAPVSGMDAMSLGNEGEESWVSRNATAVIVGVAVLLLGAFAAGFLIASR